MAFRPASPNRPLPESPASAPGLSTSPAPAPASDGDVKHIVNVVNRYGYNPLRRSTLPAETVAKISAVTKQARAAIDKIPGAKPIEGGKTRRRGKHINKKKTRRAVKHIIKKKTRRHSKH